MDRTATQGLIGAAKVERKEVNTPFPNPNLEAEVERIQVMNIAELRALWWSKMKDEPPKAFGPDLLRRSLAYKVQEDAYGGLDPKTKKLLQNLVTQALKNGGKVVMPRHIQAGAVLVRQWKGKPHRVTVLDEGFSYDDSPYKNLSEIARQITGTRWNGPRFFGLRAERADADAQ